jgi:hypothetical protein
MARYYAVRSPEAVLRHDSVDESGASTSMSDYGVGQDLKRSDFKLDLLTHEV